MVVILEPGFETVTNWTYEESNSSYDGAQSTGWVTEGAYSYKFTAVADTYTPNQYCRLKQTINIPAGFAIIFDLKVMEGSYGGGNKQYFIIQIDGVTVYSKEIYLAGTNGVVYSNQTIDLSAYSGNGKVISVGLEESGTVTYFYNNYAYIDNIREGVLTDNAYVDINKSDDTGAGSSWATAKKTMKAGWDILNSAGTMHLATGDYSAQATIAYNKSWKLSPEDPNTTGAKNVKIPKST